MRYMKKSKEQLIDDNRELEKYQDRYIRIIENAKDMIYRMSLPDGKYEYVSPACKEIFGYEPKVFIDTPVLIQKAIHPDFAQYFQNEWQKLLDGNVSPTYEYKIINKSGEERWLNQRNVLIKDENGKAIAIEGVVTDITQRKQVELERDNLLRDLGERAKELNCLYKISDFSFEQKTIKGFLKKVVRIIPPSFQYSEDCSVKITIDSNEYQSENYKKSKWKIKHDININNEKVGEIEINYLKELPEHYQGPFLKEELELINGIAELISRTVDYKLKELELKEKNEEYHSLYEEYLSQNEELQEQNEEFQALNEELTEEMNRRVKIQEELQKAHEQQLALFDGIDDVIYVADPDTYEVLYFNKTARDIWGQDALGKKCYKVLQNRDEPCPFCSNDKIFGKNKGKLYVWEFQNEISKQWFRCADKAIKWNNGKMVRFELASDISEIKTLQIEMKEKEERLSLAMEGTNDGLWDWNLKTNKIYFSKPWKKIIGYNDSELKNAYETWESLVHPEDIEQAKKAIDDYLNDRSSTYECEFRMKHKKGHWVNILSRGKVNLNENGEKDRFVGTHLDVTELRKVEREFRSVFENSPLGKSITGINGGLRVNKAFCNMLGYSEEELKNKNWKEITYPNDIQESTNIVQSLLKGEKESAHYEKRYIHKNGNIIYTDVNTTLLRDSNNEPQYFITTISDITERKQIQLTLENTLKELERSNKELEQFAYVASHDLQEPLRKVKNFAELFAKKYAGALDEKADQYIYYMTSGTDRMQNLILDLLTYSRVSTRGKEFVKTNLNSVVNEVKENLQISIEENNIKITYEELPIIEADESQIKQVFQNLLSNAIKFKSDNTPEIKIRAVDEKDYWKLSVSDNGIGIDMQYKEKIFEVFQRLHSKEEYKGTGIGLAICKKVIERHKGKIWIESKQGVGTTFYFTIPKKLNNYE